MQNNKNSILIKTIGITSVILIVIMCGIYLYKTYMPRYNTYIKVGEHKISECEYTYYYNSYYNYYINNFSPYFDYMGVNPDEDLLTQEYDNGITFEQMFNDATVDQIKEIYCLYDEAESKNFEFDTEELYEGFINTVTDAIKDSNITTIDYFKNYYGSHISEKLVKKYITMGYYSLEYYNNLVNDMGQDKADEYVLKLKNKMEVVYY